MVTAVPEDGQHQPTASRGMEAALAVILRHGMWLAEVTVKHWTFAMPPRLTGRTHRTIELSEGRLAAPKPVGLRRPPVRRLKKASEPRPRHDDLRGGPDALCARNALKL